MAQDLAHRETNAVSTSQPFSPEQIDLLKRTIARDHTDDELQLFLAYCRSRGLDPFAREVYSIKRAGRVTIQTGIDGFRKRAEETGEYDGQEIYWCGPDGVWVDVWLSKEPPAACKVVTYRRGATKPFIGIAKWSEYKPVENDFMWIKMPANQLAKCAEALSLRKAFPGKLGGLYSADEMAQASSTPAIKEPKIAEPKEEKFDAGTGEVFDGEVVAPPPAPVAPRKLSPKQQAYLFGLGKKKGWEEADIKAYTSRFFKKQDPTTLTSAELDVVIRHLQTIPDASSPK